LTRDQSESIELQSNGIDRSICEKGVRTAMGERSLHVPKRVFLSAGRSVPIISTAAFKRNVICVMGTLLLLCVSSVQSASVTTWDSDMHIPSFQVLTLLPQEQAPDLSSYLRQAVAAWQQTGRLVSLPQSEDRHDSMSRVRRSKPIKSSSIDSGKVQPPLSARMPVLTKWFKSASIRSNQSIHTSIVIGALNATSTNTSVLGQKSSSRSDEPQADQGVSSDELSDDQPELLQFTSASDIPLFASPLPLSRAVFTAFPSICDALELHSPTLLLTTLDPARQLYATLAARKVHIPMLSYTGEYRQANATPQVMCTASISTFVLHGSSPMLVRQCNYLHIKSKS
jgi:hypothetical protein